MKPDERFLNQGPQFWAHIRTISEQVGYTKKEGRKKGTRQIFIPTLLRMSEALESLNLQTAHIMTAQGQPTEFGRTLSAYFEYRAEVLNRFVEPRLMTAKEAKALFAQQRRALKPKCHLPMNKQKGNKKAPAYFTGLINMLIEANLSGHQCDYDPRQLTTATADGVPLRTLARRIDGAFRSAVNPIAVWEIKEYYYTTTFGSRVADGVYETLLDGIELKELREREGIDIKHYLMVDAYRTWWQDGRSYLCRIVDMLHMGYVDEVLFGREIMERMPALAKEWVQLLRSRGRT